MEMATTIKDALREHAMDLAAEVWPDKPEPTYSETDQPGHPWYILQANPQEEGVACAHLLARGYCAYLPMVMVEGVRAGRSVRNVHRPMFRGYMFLRFDIAAHINRIRNLPGVRGLLTKPGHSDANHAYAHPTDRDIEFIKSQEKEALDPKAFKAEKLAPYKVGRSVRITNGPFGGFQGKIWQLADHDRITILLQVFGRPTKAIVEHHLIEPL